MKTLKEQLREECNLTEDDFGSHASDLYVKHSEAVEKWLKSNYEFYKSCVKFRSQIDRELWFDIPFGYMEEYYKTRNVY
jgi:hypothetical protein